MNSKFKKVMGIVTMIGIVIVAILIKSSERQYKYYSGHLYELNYWWQVLVLLALVIVFVTVLMEKSRYVDMIIIYLSIISAATFSIVVFVQCRWGVVKLLDSIAGNSNGFMLFWMLPFAVAMLAYVYVALGELTLRARSNF